ncbi:uncharacterized protein A4U43_C08F24600 [Asparagus officinalis]|nr:uncharacterized protein A4U43_C08F24600 [Asparagus officinalis]
MWSESTFESRLSQPFIEEYLVGDGGKGKRTLHVLPPLPSLKKQCLASLESEPVPRDSSRIRKQYPTNPIQEPRIGSSGKEPIPLDDEEEQVDYGHNDTDTYLTELEDAGDLGDIGISDDESDFGAVGEAMSTPFSMSGGLN